jgi:glutamate/tyrosine decarboxylase-like PLP-dependent enzyme
LTSVFDQNGTGESPAATAVEHEAIALLRELFGLSPEHEGSFVTGTTMANFVGLAIGRQWVGRRHSVDLAQDGLTAIPGIKVLSGSPHSTISKTLSMLGLGRAALERVTCLPGREAVDPTALREALERTTGPSIVVANAGVVNTVDFDDIAAIGELKSRFDFWLHVDGEFGGFAACSPRYRHLVAGIDRADSIAIDLHKWLNVPYDSGVQFTRHPGLQAEVFANQAAYLRLPDAKVEFVERTPESSRRVRAFAAWFTLMAYGREGYRWIVEACCDRAAELGRRVDQSREFRLLAPVRMNVVCFTLSRPDLSAELVDRFLGRLRDGGKAFVTPTTLGGVPGARAAFSNWRTGPDDGETIWEGLLEAQRSL